MRKAKESTTVTNSLQYGQHFTVCKGGISLISLSLCSLQQLCGVGQRRWVLGKLELRGGWSLPSHPARRGRVGPGPKSTPLACESQRGWRWKCEKQESPSVHLPGRAFRVFVGPGAQVTSRSLSFSTCRVRVCVPLRALSRL